MPLAPSLLPPDLPEVRCAEDRGGLLAPFQLKVRATTLSNSPKPTSEATNECVEGSGISLVLRVPTVRLDTDRISSAMAARLASSLIGHVLFLKSQVPFPVVQLSRMPSTESGTRAAKKRADLIAAMDTLSSHLHTTFTALSTAFARRGCTNDTKKAAQGSVTSWPPARAHLALTLGPSVGAAKARVMLVVDGLEVRIWGVRDDVSGTSGTPGPGENVLVGQETESHEGDSEEDGDEIEETDSDEEDESDGDSLDSSEREYWSDCASEPPSSPSPSPSQVRESTPPSQAKSQTRLPLSPLPSPAPSQRSSASSTQLPSHAEEQQELRAAERLLSRTLANACAEEGGGMSCELAPTQTHILLRAPRRFSHPAWVPRQNLTRSLEGVLQTFTNDGIVKDVPDNSTNHKKTPRVGIKTEGVWVGCRAPSVDDVVLNTETLHEDDEMIWWAWDGKIVGFSDW